MKMHSSRLRRVLTAAGVASATLYAAGLAISAESLARTSVSLLYLEEARELADGLDTRRRAFYFDALAKTRLGTGDIEGAVRAGLEALSLFRATQFEIQEATLLNELALSFIALGNLGRAEELVTSARAIAERLDHQAAVGHILDTEATLWLARGDAVRALALVDRSLAIEVEHGPPNDQVGARITRAQALTVLGRTDEANTAWADAGIVARTLSSPTRRKRILSAWAEALAAQGRHAEAYEVMRQAL